MSREKAAAVEGLVTSDTVQAGVKLRKRLLLLFAGLVVIGLIGVGAWYAMTQTAWFKHSTTTPKVDYSKLSPTAAIHQAQTDLQNATTAQEKYEAYNHLGNAYSSNKQPAQAAAAYEQAATTVSDGGGSSGSGSDAAEIDQVNALGLAGATYLNAGQTSKAITVYEQILTILHASSDPKLTDQLPRYEDFVANLKAGN